MYRLLPRQLFLRRFAQSYSIRQILFLTALVCFASAFFVPFEVTKASDEAGSSSIWIPLVESGRLDNGGDNGGGGNGGSNPPPPPPPPTSSAWAFFADTGWKTSSASVATDAKGGMHMAYLYYEPVGDDAPTYGVYLYCASKCEDTNNWNGIGIGDVVNE